MTDGIHYIVVVIIHYSQLGDGTTTNRNTIDEFQNNTGKIPDSMTTGYAFILILMTDGSVYGCGYNGWGQFANGTTTSTNVLIEIQNNTGEIASLISSGYDHSIIMMKDQLVYGSGKNSSGQLGNGYDGEWRTTLVKINHAKPINFTDISVNTYVTNGITLSEINTIGFSVSDVKDHFNVSEMREAGYTAVEVKDASFNLSELKTGGYNLSELKDLNYTITDLKSQGFTTKELSYVGFSQNEVIPETNSLDEIKNIYESLIKDVQCGRNHTMILMTDGKIYGTGNNSYYSLNDGTIENRSTFVEFQNSTNLLPEKLICCYNSTIVLMTDGSIYGIGYNNYGQLGNGTNDNHSILKPMNTFRKNPRSDCLWREPYNGIDDGWNNLWNWI